MRGPQGCRLGVDLEFYRPRDVMGIARFAFDDAEVAALENLAPSPRDSLFDALWTVKEAMAKALAVPLLTATRACVFLQDGTSWRGTAPTQEPWRAWVGAPRSNMALSVAIIGSGVPDWIGTHTWPPLAPANWETIAIVTSQPGTISDHAVRRPTAVRKNSPSNPCPKTADHATESWRISDLRLGRG